MAVIHGAMGRKRARRKAEKAPWHVACAQVSEISFPRTMNIWWSSNPAFRYEEADDWALAGHDLRVGMTEVSARDNKVFNTLIDRIMNEFDPADEVARAEIVRIVLDALDPERNSARPSEGLEVG